MKFDRETGRAIARLLNSQGPDDNVSGDELEFLEGLTYELETRGFRVLQSIIGGYIHLNDLDPERVYTKALKRHKEVESITDESDDGLAIALSAADSKDEVYRKVADALTQLGASRGMGDPPSELVKNIAETAYARLHSEDSIDAEVERFAKALENADPEDLGQA